MADEVIRDREELRQTLVRRTLEEQAYHETSAYILRQKEKRRDRFRDVLTGIALIFVLAAGILLYAHNYTYSTYHLDELSALGDLQKTQLYPFGIGTLAVGIDSVTYLENDTVKWTQSLSFDDPILVKKGSFFALCDRNGYEFHIGDRSGILATSRVSRRIRGLDISSAGVTAVFTETNDAAYITYFDRFGNRLQVEVKTVFTASGYPLNIALSPDGQKLLVNFYSLQNGIGESRTVLYDFQNGKSSEAYAAYKIEDYYDDGTLIMDAAFFDNTHAAVVGDREIRFLTYSYVKKVEVSETVISLSDNVRSVLFSDSHLLVTEDTAAGCVCTVYSSEGRVKSRFIVPTDYDAVAFNDKSLVFLSGNGCVYYNISGRKRYEGMLVGKPVSSVLLNRSLIINTGEALQKLTFK